ncbi:hypothetical protein FRACYDRAFT_251195 [Fragilariopsis cylindrus CCMP1102]|uniref:Uncharacterized protein n=1 Tax=Fragilariopsis cylindrus CCMP1102 TaxID=635003 RepID=A0A1E7EN78_9STRA|nr:hypothetical protein FRACYDRAFT_251195 [Fragilariopsis cylindrus CCMP1102]|eukprot:OEU07390.1 hypothetical protein FRACYDRAFT_251195 [Fragilariopsis cylindrus CCMP1102]
MANSRQLQKETSAFLNKEVVAVGIFDVSLSFGERVVGSIYSGCLSNYNMKYIHDFKKYGVTPVMICAVTNSKIYLLDWEGNHDMGRGPSRILSEFNRDEATIKNHTRGFVHHTVDLYEYEAHCKIECNLGAIHSNKKMNREVLNLLKDSGNSTKEFSMTSFLS